MAILMYPRVSALVPSPVPAAIPADPSFDPIAPTDISDTSLFFSDLGELSPIPDHTGTVFVRIAVLDVSAAPADLRISALPMHWMNATPVADRSLSPGEFPELGETAFGTQIIGPAAADYPTYANIKLSSPATNVFLLEIDLEQDNENFNTGVIENWFLVLKSASTPIRVTWSVATTEAETLQPWMHIPAANLSFNAGASIFPSETADRTVAVDNYGPGPLQIIPGPLQITPAPAPGPGPGFQVVDAVTIPPTQSGTFTVRFSAALPFGDKGGQASLHAGSGHSNDPATVSVSSDPASEHNATLSVEARVGAVDTVLVLDASGSMGWAADGSHAPPAGTRRWDYLVEAANQLTAGYVSFLPGGDAGRLSVAVFPDVTQSTPDWHQHALVVYPPPGSPTPGQVGDLAWVDENTEAGVAAALQLDPVGGTPMGEGIAHGIGDTIALGTLADMEGATRWMVLMSDGAHNSGAIHPDAFFVADAVPNFADKSVHVLTVAYGEPGASNVDHALLAELATNGYGAASSALIATPSLGGLDLRKRFQEALAESLNLTFTVDPRGVLPPKGRAVHAFEITASQSNFGLFVDWIGRDDTVTITLVSPLCEQFSESQIHAHAQMRLSVGATYKHAFVADKFLATRRGTWKLILDAGPQAETPQDLVYSYSILGASTMRMRVTTQPAYATGEVVDIEAELTHAGAPVEFAHIRLELDMPAGSLNNLLAHTDVPADQRKKTLEGLGDQAPSFAQSWALEALALADMGISTTVARVDDELVMSPQGPGRYAAQISATTLPGVYRGRAVATGVLPNGDSFRCEQEIQVRVEARPDPSATEVGFSIAEAGRVIEVSVEARDRFGNVVMIDPAAWERLAIEVSGGAPQTPLQNDFDGRYRQTFVVDPTSHSAIAVRWDGRPIYRGPLIGPLRWMETVVDFEPGRARKSNAFSDPKRALGRVSDSRDPFVALAGRGGSLTLSTADNRLRATQLTVFVLPTPRRRPYRVEVLLSAKISFLRTKLWVCVGHSRGPTKTFALPETASLTLAAIRIVDLSPGEAGPKPLDQAPGVLVQGVGYGFIKTDVAPGPSKPLDRLGQRLPLGLKTSR